MQPWQEGLARAIGDREDDVAEALKVDRVTVWRWKKGERWPDPGMLFRICQLLGVSPDHLYGWKPMPEGKPTKAQLRRAADRLREALQLIGAGPETEPPPEDRAGDALRRLKPLAPGGPGGQATGKSSSSQDKSSGRRRGNGEGSRP